MLEGSHAPSRGVLDGWLARLVALAIATATAGFLFTVGRGGVSATLSLSAQGKPAAAPADAAYTACLAKDQAAINKMSEEGLANDAQIELFLTRAEARCRATTS
jgi:hypothetical protein